MTNEELEMSKKFKRTCDVTMEECCMGNKYCATCMHNWPLMWTETIDGSYCICTKKEN